MTGHIETAEEELTLCRLLAERADIRNEDVREQIRERLEVARTEMNLAENELDTIDRLREGRDSDE